jgi:hypothetical protein
MQPRSKRKFWFLVAAVVATLSLIVLVASWPVVSGYEGRASLIQRVVVDKTAGDLFGDANEPVGSPQELIIDDPKAFVSGSGPNGSKLVSESYLQEYKIYPLQIKTVRYVAGLVRLGAGVGLALGLLVLLTATIRRKQPSTATA